MELDHVFVCVDRDGSSSTRLRELGLVPTYRRVHPGQGTANECFAFDNAYLELLWLTDAGEAGSERTARTGLYERSRWRELGTSPFGIAWRPTHDGEEPPIETWDYAPAYLPAGMAIRMATTSDDPTQPLLFESPGRTGPASWPEARRGTLQRDGGFVAITGLRLYRSEVAADLVTLADRGLFELECADGTTGSRLDVELERIDGSRVHLRLPEIDWL